MWRHPQAFCATAGFCRFAPSTVQDQTQGTPWSCSPPSRPDAFREIFGQRVQALRAQQRSEILIGEKLAKGGDDEQEPLLGKFGFFHHLFLTFHFLLVGPDQTRCRNRLPLAGRAARNRSAQCLPPLDDSSSLEQLLAAKLAGFISVLKRCLYGFVVIARTDDGQCRVQWNAALFHRDQKSLLAVFKEHQDALNIFGRQACLLGDDLFVVTLVTQLLDARSEEHTSEL